MDESPLRRLPAELRCLIFEFALGAESPIILIKKPSTERYASAFVAEVPHCCALLATCKEIEAEAWPIFFACNSF